MRAKRWSRTAASICSTVAAWVSLVFALLPGSTRMPPALEIRRGIPSPIIHRTMSSMWTPMSPITPLPYSMNWRQPRGCTSSL